MNKFTGKKAVVTGGTHGMGLAILLLPLFPQSANPMISSSLFNATNTVI
ncbi:hypothetical protein [Paenibacillus harenae]|nr:hypothetical protein [Paenibacillus harenae]MDQ0061386.1 hypothetical protein [Paenibacillus harenae]